MKELMIMAATFMPEEKLMEDLIEAVNEYKLIPSEDNQAKVAMFCMMLPLKFKIGDNANKAMEVINDIDAIDKKMSIFDTNNN